MMWDVLEEFWFFPRELYVFCMCLRCFVIVWDDFGEFGLCLRVFCLCFVCVWGVRDWLDVFGLCFSAVLCVIRVYLRYFVIVWDVFEEFGLCLRVFWLCFVCV